MGLCGSVSEVYLLEKSRVVSSFPQERGYHMFYQLLASEEKGQVWEALTPDQTPESFFYLGPTETHSIEGKTDAERFQLTKQALRLIGIAEDKFTSLMRILCMV